MAKWWPFGKKKRKQSEYRGYAGANIGRLTSDWITSGTSVDAEIRGSITALRNRSRQLGRDNDYVRQAFRVIENNVVGGGVKLQAQVKMQRGQKLNEPINKMIEETWAKWCRAENCHVSGKLSFSDIERLAIRSTAESGEIFIRMVPDARGRMKTKLSLEIIEADRVDEGYNGKSESGNEIRMGVEVDQWGKPLKYYFTQKHPGDYQFRGPSESSSVLRIAVDAKDVIHLFRTERPGQTRGAPWLSSAIMRLHHMSGFEEAEIIRKRAEASVMGFVKSPMPELPADEVYQGQRVVEFQPGKWTQLAPGEEIEVPNITPSAAQFDPFMRAMLRGVASGIGISYESLSKDYSQSNYSSSRLALLDDRDNWKVLQCWMIENFHQRVFERFLDMAVLAGDLPLRGYEQSPDMFQAVRWMPRGWSWIDPAKEVAAFENAIKAGFMTQADVIAQGGGDLDEFLENRKREVERAEEMELVFSSNAANDIKGAPMGEEPSGESYGISKTEDGKPKKPSAAEDGDGDGVTGE